jgi:hypothetical protein
MWSQLVLVTNDDLGAIEPQATHRDRPWGADSWPTQIAEAMKDIRIWVDLAFKDIPSASDRVLERWSFAYVLASNGVSYTNDWQAQARDDNEDDVPLGSILNTSTAQLLTGARWEYDGVFVKVTTPNAVVATLSVEYYGSRGWTAATVIDGTAVGGAPFAQSGRIRFDGVTPTDWEPVRLNQGDEFLWLRLKVSTGLTAGAKAGQIVAIRPQLALKRVACLLSMAYIKRGLADQSGDPEYWATSATAYEQKARDLFETLKENGIALDLGRAQVVVPETDDRTTYAPVRLQRG